jgi:hypothetical protein
MINRMAERYATSSVLLVATGLGLVSWICSIVSFGVGCRLSIGIATGSDGAVPALTPMGFMTANGIARVMAARNGIRFN